MEQADIRELATATWRLEKWLDNLNAERKMAAKSALRNIKKYISGCNVEVKDPLGSKFDPGLAVEVVNNESPETPDEELIIIETLAPYVYQDGELIQYARVIICTEIKEAKQNNEIKEEIPIETKKKPSTSKNNKGSKKKNTYGQSKNGKKKKKKKSKK